MEEQVGWCQLIVLIVGLCYCVRIIIIIIIIVIIIFIIMFIIVFVKCEYVFSVVVCIV